MKTGVSRVLHSSIMSLWSYPDESPVDAAKPAKVAVPARHRRVGTSRLGSLPKQACMALLLSYPGPTPSFLRLSVVYVVYLFVCQGSWSP